MISFFHFTTQLVLTQWLMGNPTKKSLYAVLCIICIVFGYKTFSIYKVKQPRNFQTPSRQAVDACQSFTIEEKERLLNGYGDQVHHRLLELIRCDWINYPGTGGLKLNHPEKTHFSQYKQSKLLDDFMEKKTGRKQSPFYILKSGFDHWGEDNSLPLHDKYGILRVEQNSNHSVIRLEFLYILFIRL